MPLPLTIALHLGRGLVSRLIRWQTRSPYSHASLLLPDGLCIEAREGCGVRALPGLHVLAGELVDLFHVEGVTPAQIEAIAEFARRQLGKPYDYTMVARFITRRQESRSSQGKWFCSELVFAACQQAGLHLLRDTDPWEVSPGLLARSPLLVPLRLNVTPS